MASKTNSTTTPKPSTNQPSITDYSSFRTTSNSMSKTGDLNSPKRPNTADGSNAPSARQPTTTTPTTNRSPQLTPPHSHRTNRTKGNYSGRGRGRGRVADRPGGAQRVDNNNRLPPSLNPPPSLERKRHPLEDTDSDSGELTEPPPPFNDDDSSFGMTTPPRNDRTQTTTTDSTTDVLPLALPTDLPSPEDDPTRERPANPAQTPPPPITAKVPVVTGPTTASARTTAPRSVAFAPLLHNPYAKTTGLGNVLRTSTLLANQDQNGDDPSTADSSADSATITPDQPVLGGHNRRGGDSVTITSAVQGFANVRLEADTQSMGTRTSLPAGMKTTGQDEANSSDDSTFSLVTRTSDALNRTGATSNTPGIETVPPSDDDTAASIETRTSHAAAAARAHAVAQSQAAADNTDMDTSSGTDDDGDITPYVPAEYNSVLFYRCRIRLGQSSGSSGPFDGFREKFVHLFSILRMTDPSLQLLEYDSPRDNSASRSGAYNRCSMLDDDDPEFHYGSAKPFFSKLPRAHQQRDDFHCKIRLGHTVHPDEIMAINTDWSQPVQLQVHGLQYPNTSVIGFLQFSGDNTNLDVLQSSIAQELVSPISLFITFRRDGGHFDQEYRRQNRHMRAIYVESEYDQQNEVKRRLSQMYPRETGPSTHERRSYPLGQRYRFIPSIWDPAEQANYDIIWQCHAEYMSKLSYQEIFLLQTSPDDLAPTDPPVSLRTMIMNLPAPGCDSLHFYPLFTAMKWIPRKNGTQVLVACMLRRFRQKALSVLEYLPCYIRDITVYDNTRDQCPFDMFFKPDALALADSVVFDSERKRVPGRASSQLEHYTVPNSDPFLDFVFEIPTPASPPGPTPTGRASSPRAATTTATVPPAPNATAQIDGDTMMTDVATPPRATGATGKRGAAARSPHSTPGQQNSANGKKQKPRQKKARRATRNAKHNVPHKDALVSTGEESADMQN